MKQLISATLSTEAAEIYNNWEKQQKSRILSELIIKESGHRDEISALRAQRAALQMKLSSAMIKIQLKEGKTPLVEEMNSLLDGTIYYQYWD